MGINLISRTFVKTGQPFPYELARNRDVCVSGFLSFVTLAWGAHGVFLLYSMCNCYSDVWRSMVVVVKCEYERGTLKF